MDQRNTLFLLKEIREQRESQKKGAIKAHLTSLGYDEELVRDLIDYVNQTELRDEQIALVMSEGLRRTDIVGTERYLDMLKSNRDSNKPRNTFEKKRSNDDLGFICPFFIFWAGLAAIFFNFYLAIALFLVAAILFVKAAHKEGDSPLKNVGLTVWVFVCLAVMAGFVLLVGMSN